MVDRQLNSCCIELKYLNKMLRLRRLDGSEYKTDWPLNNIIPGIFQIKLNYYWEIIITTCIRPRDAFERICPRQILTYGMQDNNGSAGISVGIRYGCPANNPLTVALSPISIPNTAYALNTYRLSPHLAYDHQSLSLLACHLINPLQIIRYN